MRLVKFMNEYDAEIYINSDHVVAITSAENKGLVKIFCIVDDLPFVVQGDVSEVAAKLGHIPPMTDEQANREMELLNKRISRIYGHKKD